MSIITRSTSHSQVTAEIIEFPRPLRHKTVPCPVKGDGSPWKHGERTPEGSRYCRRLDIFGCRCTDAEAHHCITARSLGASAKQ